MTEGLAHLLDEVLPRVPLRQCVLTVPYRLRYRMAFDHGDAYAYAFLMKLISICSRGKSGS